MDARPRSGRWFLEANTCWLASWDNENVSIRNYRDDFASPGRAIAKKMMRFASARPKRQQIFLGAK
jgi:hypothetical protein